MDKGKFVALPIDALACFAKQFVHNVLEARFKVGSLRGPLAGVGCTAGEEGNHAVAHVYLIVKIAALHKVELAIKFRDERHACRRRDALVADGLAVETANDVVAYACGIGGREVDAHAEMRGGFNLSAGGHVAQSSSFRSARSHPFAASK